MHRKTLSVKEKSGSWCPFHYSNHGSCCWYSLSGRFKWNKLTSSKERKRECLFMIYRLYIRSINDHQPLNLKTILFQVKTFFPNSYDISQVLFFRHQPWHVIYILHPHESRLRTGNLYRMCNIEKKETQLKNH